MELWELANKTQFIGHSTDDSSIELLDKIQQSSNYPKVQYNMTYLEKNIVFDIKVETRDYKDTVKEFVNIINGKI